MARVVLEGETDAGVVTRLEGAGHEVGTDGDLVVRFGLDGPRTRDVPHLDHARPDLDPIEVDACLEAVQAGPGLDRARLDRLVEMLGGREGFDRFMRVYIDEGRHQVTALDEAVMRGDVVAAHRAAHTLKPTSGMVGAVALEAACRAVEEAAREGDLTGAAGRAAAIRWLFDHAASQLEAA